MPSVVALVVPVRAQTRWHRKTTCLSLQPQFVVSRPTTSANIGELTDDNGCANFCPRLGGREIPVGWIYIGNCSQRFLRVTGEHP